MVDPIDAVVRRVEPGTKPGLNEILVIVDPKNGRPVSPGILSRMMGQQYHYLVNHQRMVSRGGLHASVQGFQGKLELTIDYTAQCPQSEATKLAVAAAKGENPQKVIDDLVRDNTEIQITRLGLQEFVDDYAKCHDRVHEEIRKLGEDRLGLLLDIKVTPRNGSPAPHRVPTTVLNIRPPDADLHLDVEFEATLAVIAGKELRALLKADKLGNLEALILERAREFLESKLTLHALFTGIDVVVPKRFAEDSSVVRELAEHGRRLTSVSFRCNFAANSLFQGAKASHEGTYTFPYENKNYPGPIHVTGQYSMQLEDVAKFVTAKVNVLDEWAASELERTSRDLLFGVSHEDLCNHFADKKRELAERMRAAAGQIGYRLRDFHTITDHQLDELLRGVEIGPVEGAFGLDSPGHMLAKVRAIPEIRVADFSKVIGLVVRNDSVKTQIAKLTEQVLTSVLRKVTPEQFYVYFVVAPTTDSAQGAIEPLSVRDRIEATLRQHLEVQFGAELLTLHLSQLESDLQQLLERLRKRAFAFEVELRSPENPIPLRLEIQYQVTSVMPERWQQFQTAKPESEDVSTALRKHLEASYSRGLLTERDIAPQCCEVAHTQFGLHLEIPSIKRILNQAQSLGGDEFIAKEVRKLQDLKDKHEHRLLMRRDERARQQKLLLLQAEQELDLTKRLAQARSDGADDEAESIEKALSSLNESRATLLDTSSDDDDIDDGLNQLLSNLGKTVPVLTAKKPVEE